MKERTVFIGTGITRNYVLKALPYLISLDKMEDNLRVKRFVITIGFNASEFYVTEFRQKLADLCPHIHFIEKPIDSMESMNQNLCLQHGDFLKDIRVAEDDDVIIFTDADGIFQRDLNANEWNIINNLRLGDVGLSYNKGENQYLEDEYRDVCPQATDETGKQILKDGMPQSIFKVQPEQLENLLGDISLKFMRVFNTGFIMCTYKTYDNIFNMYKDLWKKAYGVTWAFTFQQFLLNIVVQDLNSPCIFNIIVLRDDIHGHGHFGLQVSHFYKDNQLYASLSKKCESKVFFMHHPNYELPLVYIMAPSNAGTTVWRITKPVVELKKKYFGRINFVFGESPDPVMISKADVIILHGFYSMELMSLIKAAKKKNTKVIVEMDDNLFAVRKNNPAFTQFDEKKILEVCTMAQNCDIFTVTTQELADNLETDPKRTFIDDEGNERVVERFNRKAKGLPYIVLPNSIDADNWEEFHAMRRNYFSRKNNDKVVLGFHGSPSHYEDIEMIIQQIKELLQENENLYFSMVGYPFQFENFGFDEVARKVTFVPWDRIEKYGRNFINFDIGIAPLIDDEFNRSKSPIKWMEYGVLEIPCIASDIPPFNKVITSGKDGVLVTTPKEWKEALTNMILDPKWRAKIGSEARKTVLEKHNIKHNAKNWEKVWGLEELIK